MSDSLRPELFQGRPFMHRDVVRFIAFDFSRAKALWRKLHFGGWIARFAALSVMR
jgi:hypothetical protein